MRASAYASSILLALICGCVGGGDGMRYFEVVYQYPDCTDGICFDEVLALEDGLVYLKSGNFSGDYWTSFCLADPDRLKELFSSLDRDFAESGIVECKGCRVFHLFYQSGSKTMYLSVPQGRGSLAEDFFPKAKEACSSPMDGGLIHLIRGQGKEFIDYHVFSNDVVVWERFGLRDAELLEAKVYRTDGVFSEMSGLVGEGFFSSQTGDNCPKDGLFYGFLEVSNGGRHAEYFTCGDDTPAGRAFSSLNSRLGDRP